jgi:hypothetical protein
MIYSKQSVLSKGSSLCLLNNFKAIKKRFLIHCRARFAQLIGNNCNLC